METDISENGIWCFSPLLESIPGEFKLSLGEGNTEETFFPPLEVILKREDQNPTGSLKDRGMAYLISKSYSLGYKAFVLSSSGNAAISANALSKLGNFTLKIFVSSHVDKGKLAVLQENGADLIIDDRPLSSAARYAKEKNLFNLRPSINQFGPEGYKTIAFELEKNQGEIDDLFVPVSSGVCFLGIFEGFKKCKHIPRLHLCQPSAISPIASLFDSDFVFEEKSIASALVARYSPLKDKLIQAVNESKGSGWVIDNQAVIGAQKLLQTNTISTSNEGALALAAIQKAKEKGWNLGKTVCLLTGKKY